MMLDLAACVSTGASLPGEWSLGEPRGVVVLSAEDDPADTIRPRLDAANADPSRVYVLDAIVVRDDDGTEHEHPPSLPRDLDVLRDTIAKAHAALVIIDVLVAFLDASVDGHRDQDVRRALMPLAKLAADTGAAIVVLRHLTKHRSGHAVYAGQGSMGIIGAARSALLVAADPADDDRRVLAVTACNLAAPVPSLAFRLVADPNGAVRIRWLGTVDASADDLMTIEDPEQRSERDAAGEWLTERLAECEVAAKTVQADAKAAGFSWATVRRAKDKIHARTRKVGAPGERAEWRWSLPTASKALEGTEEPSARV